MGQHKNVSTVKIQVNFFQNQDGKREKGEGKERKGKKKGNRERKGKEKQKKEGNEKETWKEKIIRFLVFSSSFFCFKNSFLI
jgi:hypothetical protein